MTLEELQPEPPPTSRIPSDNRSTPDLSTAEEIVDQQLKELRKGADKLLNTGLQDLRVLILDCQDNLEDHMDQWAKVDSEIKHLAEGSVREESWWNGPYATARLLRQLEDSLNRLDASKENQSSLEALGLEPHLSTNGQLEVTVTPHDTFPDQILCGGIKTTVRFKEGTTKRTLRQRVGETYDKEAEHEAKISAVITPVNHGGIAAQDLLEEIFVQRRACCVKVHPQHKDLVPILQKVFEPLIKAGFLQFAEVDNSIGGYIAEHREVDCIKFTGSARIGEQIQKNVGSEKEVTTELGNVGPLIIFPGNYSRERLEKLAEEVVSTVTNNGSYNCIATRAIVIPDDKLWSQRAEFLELVESYFKTIPTRYPFVPGAEEALENVADHYSNGELRQFGMSSQNGSLPWGLLRGLDYKNSDEPFFTNENFCPVLGEVTLPAKSFEEFADLALDFCNNTLWGSLGASIFYDEGAKDLSRMRVENRGVTTQEKEIIEEVIDRLQYGTVAVNTFVGQSFPLGNALFGSHPRNQDSGIGFSHNSKLLPYDPIEKTVIRAVGISLENGTVTGPALSAPAWSASFNAPGVGRWATLIELGFPFDPKYSYHVLRAFSVAQKGSWESLAKQSASRLRHKEWASKVKVVPNKQKPNEPTIFTPAHIAMLRNNVRPSNAALEIHGVRDFSNFRSCIIGSGDIGTPLAHYLALMGTEVNIGDIDLSKAEQVADEVNALGGSGRAFQLDVTDPEQWSNIYGELNATGKGIDLLANAVGWLDTSEDDEIDIESIERMIDINSKGVAYSEILLPLLLQDKGRKINGFMLNLASIAGIIATEHLTAYSMSKESVKTFSHSMRHKYLKHGVWPIAVSPYYVRGTKIIQHGSKSNRAAAILQQEIMDGASLDANSVAACSLAHVFFGSADYYPGWEARTIDIFNKVLGRDANMLFLDKFAQPIMLQLFRRGLYNPEFMQSISKNIFAVLTQPRLGELRTRLDTTTYPTPHILSA